MLKKMKSLFLVLISFLLLTFLSFFSKAAYQVEIPKDGSPALIFASETKHDLQKSYLAAIMEAKKSILIATYTITDNAVIYALQKKSEEGLEVTLICHEDISYNLEKKIGDKVKVIKKYGKGLMHLKIMVIDDQKCYIGSANLTGASLKMYGNLVTAFDSPQLSAFLTEKLLSIGKTHNHKQFTHRNFIIGGQLVEMWFLPDDKEASLRIKQLIREAKKTICVAMFTWTREDFAKEIISAASRGVRVEIAIDRSSSKGSSFNIFELLNKSNISLTVNKGSELLHHKFLYIDGKILVNGSANWTKNAFNTNDDCFVVIHDLNKEQQEEMKGLCKEIEANGARG